MHGGLGNVYAVEDARGDVTLVDAGTHARGGGLLARTVEHFGGGRIAAVVLTHHHLDHAGSAHLVRRAFGVPIFAHPEDAGRITGAQRRKWNELIFPVLLRWGIPPPTDVHAVGDGDRLDLAAGLEVIHTPGHTDGHVSFLLRREGAGVLFTGDAASEWRGRVGPALFFTSKNHRQARASYRSLASLDFDVACFGHGTPLVGDARAKMFPDEPARVGGDRRSLGGASLSNRRVEMSSAATPSEHMHAGGSLPPKEYEVGLLFVHGMGESERGDTVSQAGDAVTEWLRRWLTARGADVKILESRLRVAHEPPVPAIGSAAHSTISLRRDAPAGKDAKGKDRPEGCVAEGSPQQWLLKESWWASAFRPATFMELAAWLVFAGPWTIASHRAGIRQRMVGAPWYGRLLGMVLSFVITIVAAVLAAAITPLALGLLLLTLIPIPGLSDFARSIARKLAGSFGDLLVLARSPIRFAAMAEQVRQDIVDLSAHCRRVVVVAHSQGSAVAWHAIRREALRESEPARWPHLAQTPIGEVDRFITYGQAFRKLKALHSLHESGGGTQGFFVALGLLSTVLLIVAFVAGASLVGDAVAAEGDVAQMLAMGTGSRWIVLLSSIVGVAVVQLILEKRTSGRESAVEGDIVREVKCVKSSFGQFEWLDLWASADPAPNGPLLTTIPEELADHVRSYKIRNAASTVRDHSIYWDNATEFVSTVVFTASSVAAASEIGERDRIPATLGVAAEIRHHRATLLASGRVMFFVALGVFLYFMRDRLSVIGSLAGSLWEPLDTPLAEVGLAAAIGVGLWLLLAWGWRFVVSGDERAFFAPPNARPPAERQTKWTLSAVVWIIVAVAVPAAGAVVASLSTATLWPLALYGGLAVLGVVSVTTLLGAGGRRLWQDLQSAP